MNVTEKRTQTILNVLSEKHDAQWASSYGEPGYGDGETKGVILMNWNDVSDKIFEYLEAAGYGLEYGDEWLVDYEGESKAYRTQPDSYSWVCQVQYTENGELLTPDTDTSEWIEWAENNSSVALPNFIDVSEDHDLEQVPQEYASGWYGRSDSPADIMAELEAKGHGRIVFQIDSTGQFEVQFIVWTDRIEG